MSAPSAATGLRAAMLEAIEDDLRRAICALRDAPYSEMSEMIEYHLGWRSESEGARGKRFRPLLTLLSCQAAGGDWRRALPAACCIELIHNFSLIHDDIQDRSELRRGLPALWKKWGEAQAINVGDAVFALARLACLRLTETGVSPDSSLRALAITDQECLNLTKGQYLDLDSEKRDTISESDYLEMISGKTCSLLRASTQCGAVIAGAAAHDAELYREFGHQLGVAFQIIDDILGIWGVIEATGKPNETDLRARKQSLPIIFGIKHSPAFSEIWFSLRSSPEDIEHMKQALESVGAEVHARQLAREATSLAVRALRGAHPEESAATELESLAAQLLARQR